MQERQVKIFMSYAWDDNVPPPENPQAKGFVTALHEQLEYAFKQLGRPLPEVWWDRRRIEDGDQFDANIREAISESSLLLVVLSRNWTHREFCLKELRLFRERWEQEDDFTVGHRIVVVRLNEVPVENCPKLLTKQVGYKFYRFDGPIELGKERVFFDRGEIRHELYRQLVGDLGGILWRRARRIAEKGSAPSATEEPAAPAVEPVRLAAARNGRTIYLAKPAPDMTQAHHVIAKELGDQGFTVIPGDDQGIPLDSSATGMIDGALGSAELSIHLLGEDPGFAPSKSEPIVKLQLARAATRIPARQAGDDPTVPFFHRIIWAPRILPDDTASNGSHVERNPVDVLKQFDQQYPNDTIVGDSQSKLVQFLKRVLAPTPARASRPTKKPNGDMRIYLCHAQEDTDFAFDLADELAKQSLELMLPAFEGPPADVNNLHLKSLAECDAIALCWASAPEVWVRAQSSALRNWHVLGRKEQFAYRSVVIGPPPGGRKKAVKHLFPRSEIDLTINLTEQDRPLSELLEPLVPAEPPGQP